MKILVTVEEIMDKGHWDDYCEEHSINVWAVNEGLMSSNEEVYLSEKEAKQYGFIPKKDWED